MASLETNLNQSPYFDDYNEEKNFHRILFRPGYAVQARELTQIQSILQNQIERFGDEFLHNGTVINGCAVDPEKWSFVKLKDRNPTTQNPILLGSFFDNNAEIENATVTGATTGVTARLLYAVEGSESADPDFLTIFVSYTNSGTDQETKTFADDETLTITRNSDSAVLVTAKSIPSNSTGTGLGVSCSEGVVYHKGNFIRSREQVGVVSKYTTEPTIKIGFETVESIVDSNQDSSLLDNATGATNFTAPGASRLKIETKIATRDINSANTEDFFVVADVQDGIITRRYETSYGDLEDELALRTYEESGNYALDPFNVSVHEHLRSDVNQGVYGTTGSDTVGDNSLLVIQTEPSTGYVRGYRTELVKADKKSIDKATETDIRQAVTVGQSIGNHVICENVFGTFSSQEFDLVTLRDQAQATGGSGSADTNLEGTAVGTARIRGFEYHEQSKYRIYLYDIKMNSGKSFQADAKSLVIVDSMGSGKSSFANIVTESGNAKLKDSNLLNLVFPLQSAGVKALSSSQYVYREEQDITIASNGTATVALETPPAGGSHSFNDTGDLSTADKSNVIVVFKRDDSGSSTLTGEIWDWSQGGTIASTASSMSIDLGQTFGQSMAATVYYNVLRSSSTPAAKQLQASKHIHINTATVTNLSLGPWDLGVPDVFKLEGVYRSTDADVANIGEDITSHFTLDDGQRDSFYGGARLFKNTTSNVDTDNENLIVKFSHFTTDRTSGLGYYTLESYPVDDANPDDTSKITTPEVPLYEMSSGGVIDLRDSIDFRPLKANTCAPVSTGTAPTNPSSPSVYDVDSEGSFFPTPDENFQANIERYLPRADLVVMRSTGEIRIIKGASDDSPMLPREDDNSMTLAEVFIPPYPSLSPSAAAYYGRPKYEVIVNRTDNRRLTMADMRRIEDEVSHQRELIQLNTKEIQALSRSVLTDFDPLNCAEPPKDSIIVDPPAEPVIENTMRSSDYPFTRDPLRVIPTLEDVEVKLDPGSFNSAMVSNTVLTLIPNGSNAFVKQTFATQPRQVNVKSTAPAKLYNGQMTSDHPVCAVEQIVDVIVAPAPPKPTPSTPVIKPASSTTNYSYGGLGYGFTWSHWSWNFGGWHF
jgi:hypothetical protein